MAKAKFQEKSTFQKSIEPLIIGVVLLLLAYVGFKAYAAIQEAIKNAQEGLKKKGITLDGTKANIKVKRVDTSRYIDETQAAFVRAWNNSETRGYYSRLWSKEDKRDKPQSSS